MKISTTEANYCATVVKIHTLLELEGLDNLYGVPIHGFQALVSKDHEVGQLYIMFTAETQLSEDFCKNNNLFRHSELNKDNTKSGYIEDSRRVRAIKLRKHVSSALLMPLSSLEYLGVDTNLLKEGDTFNAINGVEVCRKYYIPISNPNGSKNKVVKIKATPKITTKVFPEHFDTSHWLKNEKVVSDNTELICTLKLHGTSVRLTNQISRRKLSFVERMLKFFGFRILENEYGRFAASRRVIKENNVNGYYSSDIWNDTLLEVSHLIPKNWVLFGEIIGWAGDKPIQENYTYQIPNGKHELYIYRIAIVNEDGVSVDLSWDRVVEWCKSVNLKHVPEVWRGKKQDLDVFKYSDKKFVKDLRLAQCLPLDKEAPCDEGIVIRIEGLTPVCYKFKSPLFIAHESKQLDKGVVDMESGESQNGDVSA